MLARRPPLSYQEIDYVLLRELPMPSVGNLSKTQPTFETKSQPIVSQLASSGLHSPLPQ